MSEHSNHTYSLSRVETWVTLALRVGVDPDEIRSTVSDAIGKFQKFQDEAEVRQVAATTTYNRTAEPESSAG